MTTTPADALVRKHETPKPTVQLSLNLPALEHLIGGDSQVEVELRKSVVQEFAKRHLTSVAKVMTNELKDDLAKAIAEATKEIGLEPAKWPHPVRLTDDLFERLKTAVEYSIHTKVRELVQEHTSKAVADIIPHIEAKVDRVVEDQIVMRVKAKLAADLTKALNS